MLGGAFGGFYCSCSSLLVIGCLLLIVVGNWLLVIGCLLLIDVGWWLLLLI